MRLFTTAVLAVALAPTACAGDPAWQFKPGQTFTYECTSEFHYVMSAATQALAGNGQSLEMGTTTEDPQWEAVTLKATVLNVGDDGSARIQFEVVGVRIETRFDSSGDHAVWDSSKDKETDLVGYKQYQAILGHKFSAIIGPDGKTREIKMGEWPRIDTTGMKPNRKNEREERAAGATHRPTPTHAWLDLMFHTAPSDKAEFERTLRMPQDEKLAFRNDGSETVGKYACAKMAFRSPDKERGVKPEDLKGKGGDVQDVAMALVEATQKKGTVWFSRKAGCLVKVEMEGATEMGSGGSIIRTHFKWGVELKDRGFTELTPGGNGDTPTKENEPTPTK
jgi:hypothetical protein